MASEIQVQTISGPPTGANANKVIIPAGQTLDASAGGITLPAGTGGKLLQVRNRVKRNMEAYNSGAWHTVLEDDITPSSSSSKILITGIVAFAMAGGDGMVRIERNGTVVGVGTDGSSLNGIAGQASGSYNNMTALAACSYQDSPSSSSAVTYKLQIRGDNTIYVNRRNAATDYGSGTYLTLMEIAG